MHHTFREKHNQYLEKNINYKMKAMFTIIMVDLTISLRNEKYGMLVYGKEKRITNQPFKFIKIEAVSWAFFAMMKLCNRLDPIES